MSGFFAMRGLSKASFCFWNSGKVEFQRFSIYTYINGQNKSFCSGARIRFGSRTGLGVGYLRAGLPYQIGGIVTIKQSVKSGKRKAESKAGGEE